VSDDLIRVGFGADTIQFSHHFRERTLDLADGPLGIELALCIETTLTLDELLAVERREGVTQLV
jgi:hypothetical protein